MSNVQAPKLNLDNDQQNYLYYMAKNLAIDNTLRKLEKYFPESVNAQAEWHEDSLSPGNITIKFQHRGSHDSRTIGLNRSKPYNYGGMEHTVKSIQTGDFYEYRKPKYMIRIDELLEGSNFKDFIEKLVDDCNYPFKYEHHTI